MGSIFILADGETAEKIDLAKYKKSIPCNFLFSSSDIHPREDTESWDAFSKRVNRIVELFDESILKGFQKDHYSFISMPACYSDYQWAKWSEFRIIGGGSVSTYSFGSGVAESYSYKTVNCYNSELIKSLFDRKRLFINYLFDFEQYISVHSNDDTLCCKVWLARTSVGGRRSTIENHASEGDCVLLIAYNIGDYISPKSFYPISDRSHFLICTQSGNEIGDIDFGSDLGPEDESNHDNTEYWEVYMQPITDGSIVITDAHISQIIPHGAARGRKIKPLVEVNLHMKQIAPINRASNNLFPPETNFVRMIRKTATMMKQLAVLDYNRKCDIINGIIPDTYSVEQILPDVCADLSEYRPLRTQPVCSFSLLGLNLSFDELGQFWNVFSPLYSAIRHEDYSPDCLETTRFVTTDSLLFMLEMHEGPNHKMNGKPCISHTLTIFKKRMHRKQ